MVNSRNQVYDGVQWFMTDEDRNTVVLNDGETLHVTATDIRSTGKKRLVWHWYNVSGRVTDSRIGAKLLEAWAFLSALDRHAYTVAISYEYDDGRRNAEDVLRSFVEDNFSVIEQCMAMEEQNANQAAPCYVQSER